MVRGRLNAVDTYHTLLPTGYETGVVHKLNSVPHLLL